MRTSEQTKELFSAIIAAQAEMPVISKDSDNPFFSSKYASLPDIVRITQPILKKHDLAVVQGGGQTGDDGLHNEPKKDGKERFWSVSVTVNTRIIHKTGQWIEDSQVMWIEAPNPQKCGAALSYGRRYGYSMLGVVADEDDDGNKASGNKQGPPPAGQTNNEATDAFLNGVL